MKHQTFMIKNFSRITKIVQVSAMKVHFQIAERSLFYLNPDIHYRRMTYPSERVYHWYREDKGGYWSHKPGITPVTNIDASGRLISNPAKANHNYGLVNYNNGGIKLWVRRL